MAITDSGVKKLFRQELATELGLNPEDPFLGCILHLAEQTGIHLNMETLMRFLSQICTANCGKLWQVWFNTYPLFSINLAIDAAKKWVQQNCPEKEENKPTFKHDRKEVIIPKPMLNATQVFFATVKHKTQWTQGGYGIEQHNPA